MPTTDTKIKSPIVNVLTKAQYNSISSPSSEEFYLITDDTNIVAGNGIEVTTSSNGETLVSLKESTLWTGILKGGNTLSLDVSNYDHLRVYAKLFAVIAIYEIDLTTINNIVQIDGYRYGNGTVVSEFTADGTLEYLISQSLVSTDKKTFYHYHCGYSSLSGSYTSKDNDSAGNYYVYKIDGIRG